MIEKDESRHASELRKKVILLLAKQGYVISNGKIVIPNFSDKSTIRAAHRVAVDHNIQRAKGGLYRYEDKLLQRIANGSEVSPTHFKPRLLEVQRNTEDELLFRYVRLHWSIPVSAGYGRRMRFLVIDEYNEKLVGIIGLGDPVFALEPRDRWIGWATSEKQSRLSAVMDAFVLGAVPPYSFLLGGKLIAMLATSNEVREAIERKYRGRKTRIRGVTHDGRVVLLTTTSALGRSSIYNRLTFQGRKLMHSVGYTKGSGDFHFNNGLYKELKSFAEKNSSASAKDARWGRGFRNRREVIRKALSGLGMQADLVYHGVKREVYVAPLARNTREYLRGEQGEPVWFDQAASDLIDAFVERWLLPRAQRDQRYLEFNREQYRLWSKER